jgi:hypothetical protein
MSLLLDENLSPALSSFLVEADHDVDPHAGVQHGRQK